ncbi:uncharacterized protein LOC123542942 [Mercenaria mercenaria]|uniref:uncharacterized protein LOC123542942 n=1 Tax=Mercenaria mercenaria TaxID=6596 RepID=UPI00234F6A16|nr:uncharacterized protein LOC123542942 [Mercenaria mercenaria]XP_045184926.2 uncharacterized protein LOC123542942 [Mercenaria mercenaria]XP_045184927.2 uncharacterized protein LOC123542942 [Mercenaria mercenaria]XP_045184928.2 uncharacterized protein LOC123542942 [Mercenaria mercenaria]
MVSERVIDGVMSACAEFTQNAWKKDLCINCQRPRAEHAKTRENESSSAPHKSGELGADSPKPAKRNSLMTKSWTAAPADGKNDENEDDQWNAMCLPDPDQPDKRLDDTDTITKPLNDTGSNYYPEHSYEDIDGEDLKQGQRLNKSSLKFENKKTDKTVTVIPVGNDKITSKSDNKGVSKPVPNPEERLSTLIHDGNKFPPDRDPKSRSRSSSREKSPAPAPKPKLFEKPVIADKTRSHDLNKGHRHSEGDITKPIAGSLSPRSRKKLKKGQRSISFKEDESTVIGDDGGLDNLYSDHEDDFQGDDNDNKEIMRFTEDEKEWALQALKNTIWNTEHINAESDKSDKKNAHSKEYEDLKMESLWKPDRFANVRECDPLPESATQNFGTFPLRTKSEKTAMDNMFSGNRLSTLSESLENMLDESNEDKYEAVLKFLGADKIDFSGSPKHKNAVKGDLNVSDCSDPSYDDPWEGKFGFESESEMNLLDEIKGEIDLDSSTAGFALVDLLNDVLSKYSTGTPSETDSVKNLDSLEEDRKSEKADKSDKKDGKEKSAELEAKMVTLAASLRKQRAKGRAPRPPSCPPQPPPEVTNSPQKQLELRAAQSKEPTFKMVPIGKPIGGNPLSQSAPAPSSTKPEISGSTSSSNSSENIESYKIKTEKDKQPKKSGGGIGGFFSRILRRGRDSDTDLTISSETLVSNSSDGHSDTDSLSEKGGNFERQGSGRGSSRGDKHSKGDKRTSKSSPQMKMKVLPTRPVSPKPPEKPPHVDSKKETEKDTKPSQNGSPKVESKTKDNVKAEKSEINTSQKNNTSKPEQSVSKLSPSKSSEKELAASPKTKEAPPLPLHPPREGIEPGCGPPKPRARGNSDGGVPRSRPRMRDAADGRPRDTPNVPPPKPPVAVKPRPPATHTKSLDISDNSNKPAPVQPKERLASTSSLEETAKQVEDANKKPDPRVLRKRAKSPKRFAAPVAPVRASMPNILSDSNASLTSNASESSIQSLPESKPDQPKGLAFAKELEQKLQKEQSSATLDGRKLSAPPPLPTTAPKIDSEKSKTLPADNRKTASKDKDIPKSTPKDPERSRSNSKDDLKTSPPASDDKAKFNSLESENQSQTAQEPAVPPMDMPIHTEKIELPKAAGHSRKSFLGKLNRKNKPPAPPSVKRTKSITESHVLADHHMKKIDLKDISGPVLITEMSSNKVVNRRNTISLGDDNPFLSGGSTSSGSTSGEKSDISPRGSVENLYEFIKTEAPTPPVGDKKNLYDPVVENNVVGLRPPSMTGSEGYLEPIKSNSAGGELVFPNMAESTSSMGSMTTSMVAMANTMADMSKSTDSFQTTTDVNQHGLEDLDISPERRELLASQPIYEEITNGYGKFGTGQTSALEHGDEHFENVEEEFYGVHDPPQNNEPNQILASNLKNKESFSSDSELSSANSSLSRPRPFPRKRPRHVGSGFEQYVAMNRPSVAVFLNEEQLREMLSKLTAMNLNTLRDIYTQHEKCFTKESLHLGSVGPLKWQDFDIYGKPLHTSEKCVVYNAKMRTTMSPCQVMLLHSRPEITAANHPSMLKPTCIFTDSVPFSYLTDAFIKTSQILETTVNQANANMAKCFIVVGLFDITESLTSHMNSLETVCENQRDFLRKVLFFVLQLLSAISHCLEQGHPLSEADFHDLYLISNPYCLGETVSFLPQVRAPEDQRIDRVCLFLEKFILDMCAKCEANAVLDDSAFFIYTGVQRVIELVESGVAECLPIVRSYTEFLLWGPGEGDSEFRDDRLSNLEPKLSMWLEKERAMLIHDFAGRIQRGARCNIKDFYKMKFLLKASSGSLAECIRCHTASAS